MLQKLGVWVKHLRSVSREVSNTSDLKKNIYKSCHVKWKAINSKEKHGSPLRLFFAFCYVIIFTAKRERQKLNPAGLNSEHQTLQFTEEKNICGCYFSSLVHAWTTKVSYISNRM